MKYDNMADLRLELNKIDSSLLSLFKDRFNLIHEASIIKKNTNVSCVIADHWKSLELIKTSKKKICLIHSKEINHKKGSFANRRILKAFSSFYTTLNF